MSETREAFVIGSGPNGLTAAVLLAKAGFRTTVFEAKAEIGGGTSSAELTAPGFIHDVGSAVHPLAVSSPVFAGFPLEEHGLRWIHPRDPLAHPLDGGRCVLLKRSVAETAAAFGDDGARYRRTFQPLATRWLDLAQDILAPARWPKRPFLMGHFGLYALWPAEQLARKLFQTEEARALFAGNAAHSFLPLSALGSSAFGMVMQTAAHGVGWPIPRGGAQQIANSLGSYFRSLGGTILTSSPIESLRAFPRTSLIFCDVTPRQLLAMEDGRLTASYRKRLSRFRYGPGIFKLDWALSQPIPWGAADCLRAATVHCCGSAEEVSASEYAVSRGLEPHRPFVLLVQPSLFDETRAPEGKHTAWAYCHVPNGSTFDMTERIEAQVERFAPGFRASILARSALNTHDMEQRNSNLVGGDINGGAMDLPQLFLRPTASMYRTSEPGLYLCSSSTPPGGAVHGMCGYNAVRLALRTA